jgi:hypothetical protein
MDNLYVDQKILQDRFQKLGWTSYRLAQEVGRIRVSVFGEPARKPANLVTAVEKVIDDPNTSSFKNVEAAIRAMGGDLVIRWQNTEQVVTSHEEVKL